MKKTNLYGMVLALSLLTVGVMTAHASTDYCFQLSGGPFSGDLGFFRFKGKRPVSSGQVATLSGRVAGLSPVFGTATVAKDGSFAEFGVTFFADADEVQFDISFFPPPSSSGSGYGDYGDYGTSVSVTVTVVSCTLEP